MDLFESLGLGPKPPDDNTVFYELYPSLDQPAGETELLALRALCMQHIQPLLHNYIWQKEAFELTPSTISPRPWAQTYGKKQQARRKAAAKVSPPDETGSAAQGSSTGIGPDGQQQGPACLWGSLCWGENVEDEWLVVYLLLEMTQRMTGLTARVWDNDGEFLLIEAAYALPKWLKPESAANRVWLREGHLHIVPLPSSKHPSLPSVPSTLQALQIVASDSVPTAAPKAHAAIAARLEGYPGKALQAGCHRSKAILPCSLAAALKANPQLVSSAVDAFYFRDGDDMKAAARMRHFPPSKPRTTMLVATNRCQYAQLAQQPFAPPRGWRLPPPDHPDLPPAERGLKITAGFEILMARSDRVPKPPAASAPESQQIGKACANGDASCANAGADSSGSKITTEARLQGLPTWGPYKASLERLGYFQSELPGSSRYKELMAAAISNFVAGPGFAKGTAAVLGPAEELRQLLDTVGGPAEAGASSEDAPQQQNVDSNGNVEVEDSDSWMEAQGAVVEEELAKRQAEMESGPLGHGQKGGKKKSPKPAATDEEAAGIDAVQVAERIRGFVEAMSGLEGAELPSSAEEVGFNPAAFARELEQVLGVPFGGDGARQRTDEDEEDEWDESTEEGSSFFSDDDEAGLDTSEDDEEGEEGKEKEADGERSREGQEEVGVVCGAEGQQQDSCPTKIGLPAREGRPSMGSSSGGHASSAATPTATPAAPTEMTVPGGTAAPAVQGDMAASGGHKGRTRGRRRSDGSKGQPAALAAADGPQQPALPPRLQHLQDLWEVRTATDSDDDDEGRLARSSRGKGGRHGGRDEDEEEDALSIGGHSSSEEGDSSDDNGDSVVGGPAPDDDSNDGEAGFMEAYEAELEAQLRGTTLDASFERGAAPAQAETGLNGGKGRKENEKPAGICAEPGLASAAGPQRAGVSGEAVGVNGKGDGEDEALQPVDLDLNLVRNLVRSVASQQGFAGPGTNLASLLGVDLPQKLQPDDADGGSS